MRKTSLSMLIAAALLPAWAGMATIAGMATVKETNAPKAAPASTASNQALGQAETIQGSLVALVKEQSVIVLKADRGVPYNFKVTPATKIEIGGKKAGFKDLDTMTNANISVTFVPMRQGNIARKIQAGQ